MGKEGAEYHFEYRLGCRVYKKDFDNKFDCFMKFEKKQEYDVRQINLELSLVRAAQTIKGGPAPTKGPNAMQLVETANWFECKHCHKNVDNGTCCAAYESDTRNKTARKQSVDTKAIRRNGRVVPYIKNLKLVTTGTGGTWGD